MEELIEKFRYKKNKAAFAQSKIKYLERMEKIEDPTSDDAYVPCASFHTARKRRPARAGGIRASADRL